MNMDRGNNHSLIKRATLAKNRTNLLFLLLIMFLFSGCNNPFNPETVVPKKPITRVNDTPRDVLENLEIAYKTQDIELFSDCLSKSFRFELLSVEIDEIGVDMDGDGIKDSWWDYSKEVDYHRNLFKTGSSDGSIPPPDAIYLNFQIPQESLWDKDNHPGREDWVIIPAYFNLILTLYGTSNITADGYARFYLRPENNEWKIIIWRDESNI